MVWQNLQIEASYKRTFKYDAPVPINGLPLGTFPIFFRLTLFQKLNPPHPKFPYLKLIDCDWSHRILMRPRIGLRRREPTQNPVNGKTTLCGIGGGNYLFQFRIG